MIKIVIKEPDKTPYIKEVDGSLQSMQSIVGGHIEVIPADIIVGAEVLPKDKLLLVINEEGRLNNLRLNFPICNNADWIMGTAFICKADEEEMVGLTDDEAALVMGLFKGKEG